MIKFLVMDVDGTLTDGKLYIGNDGEIMKVFSIKDGSGIKDILPIYQIIPIILTARESIILERRCRELNVTNIHQNCKNKKEKLQQIALSNGLIANREGIYEDIAYIGDDITDLEAMRICGLKGCPLDAIESIKHISNFVSSKNGGEGAVREFIEWVCKK